MSSTDMWLLLVLPALMAVPISAGGFVLYLPSQEGQGYLGWCNSFYCSASLWQAWRISLM